MRIWQPETGFDVYLALAEEFAIGVSYHFPPGEPDDFAKSLYTRIEMKRSSPAATLILALDDFNADFFEWHGSAFVSERMREAMALKPSEVRFYPVDNSQSVALPRSKNYQIMEPVAAEDVLDREASQYHLRQFLPAMPPVPTLTGRMAVRPAASPTHDLFYDSFFTKEMFCTDALAQRVLKAGCTGLKFMDPNSRGDRNLYRTLRGVEEWVGNDPNGLEITQIVEAID